jgi:hypothetical protein
MAAQKTSVRGRVPSSGMCDRLSQYQGVDKQIGRSFRVMYRTELVTDRDRSTHTPPANCCLSLREICWWNSVRVIRHHEATGSRRAHSPSRSDAQSHEIGGEHGGEHGGESALSWFVPHAKDWIGR